MVSTAEIPTIVEEPAKREAAPYIAFEHVSKCFGDTVVLDDVSFFVNPGETLCILGRSGVGKSVTLQQIMGFIKPDSGRILVAGENICGFNEEQMQAIRRKVTIVFRMERFSTHSASAKTSRFHCGSAKSSSRTRSSRS